MTTTDQKRAWRQAKLAERIRINGRLIHPRALHGSSTGYNNWGCRCWPCTNANTQRGQHARAKARATHDHPRPEATQ